MVKINDVDDATGSSGSSSGGAGSVVKMVDFITTPSGSERYERLLALIQEGQKKHGSRALGGHRKRKRPSATAPSADDINEYQNQTPQHPILKEFGYYFAGADSPESQVPSENVDAREELAKQLALQLGQKFRHKQTPNPHP